MPVRIAAITSHVRLSNASPGLRVRLATLVLVRATPPQLVRRPLPQQARPTIVVAGVAIVGAHVWRRRGTGRRESVRAAGPRRQFGASANVSWSALVVRTVGGF